MENPTMNPAAKPLRTFGEGTRLPGLALITKAAKPEALIDSRLPGLSRHSSLIHKA